MEKHTAWGTPSVSCPSEWDLWAGSLCLRDDLCLGVLWLSLGVHARVFTLGLTKGRGVYVLVCLHVVSLGLAGRVCKYRHLRVCAYTENKKCFRSRGGTRALVFVESLSQVPS